MIKGGKEWVSIGYITAGEMESTALAVICWSMKCAGEGLGEVVGLLVEKEDLGCSSRQYMIRGGSGGCT